MEGDSLSGDIWRTRYRHGSETGVEATLDRVAGALAATETDDIPLWRARFRECLSDYRFLPGGRILAGAGTGQIRTLFNCFVMGPIEDSLEGILRAMQETAVTLQQGGGGSRAGFGAGTSDSSNANG